MIATCLQMMSMGCSMVPMIYPGVPQYMPTMGMGMHMGMGTGMGMNRPMVPYPSLMPGPAMQNTAAAVAQMTPRFPVPAYHLPSVPVPDPSRIRAANQPDHPIMNSLVGHNTNQPRLPNLSDPYQQCYALHQAQVLPQASPLFFSLIIFVYCFFQPHPLSFISLNDLEFNSSSYTH